MQAVSYTTLRNNLAGMMDKIEDDQAPLLVTRRNGKHAVIMPLDYFNSYEATSHLFSTKENAEKLNQSIEQAEKGFFQKRDIVEK